MCKNRTNNGWKMQLYEFMPILLKLYYHYIKDKHIRSLLNIYDSKMSC